jgi:hypothetical protein
VGGVLGGIIVLGSMAFFCWRRQKRTAANAQSALYHHNYQQPAPAEVEDSAAKFEAPAEIPEMATQHDIAEMDAGLPCQHIDRTDVVLGNEGAGQLTR